MWLSIVFWSFYYLFKKLNFLADVHILLMKMLYIVEEKFDSWITSGNLILGFENLNREIGMVESDFYIWFLNQSFYWQYNIVFEDVLSFCEFKEMLVI